VVCDPAQCRDMIMRTVVRVDATETKPNLRESLSNNNFFIIQHYPITATEKNKTYEKINVKLIVLYIKRTRRLS